MSKVAPMTRDFANSGCCALRRLWGREATGCLGHFLQVQCCKVKGGCPPLRLFTPSWRKIIGSWNDRRSDPNSRPSRYPRQMTIPPIFKAKADLRSFDDTVCNPTTMSVSFARSSSKTRSRLHGLPLTHPPHTVLRCPTPPPWHSVISPGSDLSG